MPNDPKMLGHYLVTPFEEQDILERGLSYDTRFAALHASGHTEASLQKALDEGDPLVFPELADPKVLAKFPPTVMIEGEFDKYVTPAGKLAQKLDSVGKLLEYIEYPGSTHTFHLSPNFKRSPQWK